VEWVGLRIVIFWSRFSGSPRLAATFRLVPCLSVWPREGVRKRAGGAQ